jgi:transcriptional regulator with XRE-family HTH domain
MVGVSQQLIDRWEKGGVMPGAGNMAKVMNALGSPSSFFFVDSATNGSQKETI